MRSHFCVSAMLVCALSVLLGCQTIEIPPTQPLPVESTKKGIGGLRSDKVIVLSPVSFEAVESSSKLLVGDTSGPSERVTMSGSKKEDFVNLKVEASRADDRGAVGHASDFNMASSEAERYLLDEGWSVVTQALLARQLKEGLQKYRGARQMTLLEAALELGGGESRLADYAILLPSVRVEYDARPAYQGNVSWFIETSQPAFCVSPLVAVVEGIFVDLQEGSILWKGRATMRATDLLDAPATVAVHEDRKSKGLIDILVLPERKIYFEVSRPEYFRVALAIDGTPSHSEAKIPAGAAADLMRRAVTRLLENLSDKAEQRSAVRDRAAGVGLRPSGKNGKSPAKA